MLKPRLLAPGPVEVPPQVLEALARPAMHHRTPAFRQLFLRARERLSEILMVPGRDALILAGSGTAAFEAGLLACLPQGAKVIGLRAGKFGERWVAMARAFGFEVVEVEAPWGRVVEPERVADALRAHPDAAAVTTTHSETSTGVLHDVRAMAEAVRSRAPDALILVDAVTSLAAAELRPLEWGLDGVFAGSQKGLMLPPGLGFAYLSERAWARGDGRPPSFYLDLHRERAKQAEGETAFTPAVPLVAGLEVAGGMLLEYGMERVWRERANLNGAVLAAGAAAGLRPFAERPSPAAAALETPEGVEAPEVVRRFAARGVRIAGGQDAIRSRVIRPSTVGYADRYDALTLAAVLEETMRELGRDVPIGAATGAALRHLSA